MRWRIRHPMNETSACGTLHCVRRCVRRNASPLWLRLVVHPGLLHSLHAPRGESQASPSYCSNASVVVPVGSVAQPELLSSYGDGDGVTIGNR